MRDPNQLVATAMDKKISELTGQVGRANALIRHWRETVAFANVLPEDECSTQVLEAIKACSNQLAKALEVEQR